MTRIVENRSGVLVSTEAVEVSAGAGDAGRIPQLNSSGLLDASMLTGGGGSVSTVSVVTANGVSGSVANPTTTPAITLTLGAITPSSVASTGAMSVTASLGGNPFIDLIDSGAPGSGSGGLIRLRSSSKPTAVDQRLGGVQFGAVDSSSVIQNSAAILAKASEDWGTLAGEGTYLLFEITANGATSRSTAATLNSTGLTLAGTISASNFSGSHSGTSSGTNTGDQTITLTGDITGSGTGSFTTAIGTGVIVNADVSASAAIALSKLATVTAAKALVSDASGFVSASSVTGTELGYVSGVTSAIQTQLNGKQATLSPAALTRTNDTNVTLTLGGTPATALLQATSLTLGWSGQLAASRGGTGVSSLGDITRVNDTNVTLTLGGTPTGAVINSTSFTLGWTGTLASSRGGTGNGFTKFTGPATTERTFTLPNSDATLLYSGGALGTPSSGTLTNCTGLPIAGLTASTSTAIGVGSIELGHATDTTIARSGAGDITIEGNAVYRAGGTDVPVADGGTGASTLTGLLQGNGTSAFTTITNSTTVGQCLRVTGSNTYAWGALDLADTDAVTGVLPAANGGANQAAWSSWTPSWTNLTVGNGTVEAKYSQDGKRVFCRLAITFGTTTSISGSVVFSLPVTSVTYGGTATLTTLGHAALYDQSADIILGGIVKNNSTTHGLIRVHKSDGTYTQEANLSSTVPFTWATSDQILLTFFYEAA